MLTKQGITVVLLYMCEAHAKETWPLSAAAPVSHSTETDRLHAAEQLLARFPGLAAVVGKHVYLDSLDNQAATALGFWPERYVFIEDGRVHWESSLRLEDRFADLPKAIAEAAKAVW